jgi:hypothetical protein
MGIQQALFDKADPALDKEKMRLHASAGHAKWVWVVARQAVQLMCGNSSQVQRSSLLDLQQLSHHFCLQAWKGGLEPLKGPNRDTSQAQRLQQVTRQLPYAGGGELRSARACWGTVDGIRVGSLDRGCLQWSALAHSPCGEHPAAEREGGEGRGGGRTQGGSGQPMALTAGR